MKYKALISDVDGTLVINRAGSIHSQAVYEAIQKAKQQILVGVATARPLEKTLSIINTLELNAPCILTGGAQVYDPVQKRILKEKVLTSEQIQVISEIGRESNIPLLISDATHDENIVNASRIKKPLDIYTYPLEYSQAQEFIEKISHIKTIAVHRTPAWDEGSDKKIHVVISHPQATKQQGIFEVAEVLGISTQEIIGIGEGYNDFPLLMACGLKIAMGNAVEDVKAIADHIVPSVEQDGVVYAIENFILS